MYLSRITLDTSSLSALKLHQLVERGEYVMHQWLWDLFPHDQERKFLYRREELQGAFRFFVLSPDIPDESNTFTVEPRPFAPVLSVGQQLRFSLRANPTIFKAGKRHDLLMETKRQMKDLVDKREIWSYQQKAAKDWLVRQGEQGGFTLVDVNIDAYRQQQTTQAKTRRTIQFSSVDYSGVLKVNEPSIFLQKLVQGYGKTRAFGCGLMLIKPEVTE